MEFYKEFGEKVILADELSSKLNLLNKEEVKQLLLDNGISLSKILIWLLETGAKNMHVATIVGTRPEIIKMSKLCLRLIDITGRQ